MTLYKVKIPATEERKSFSVFVDSNECEDIKEQGIKMLSSQIDDIDKDKVVVRKVVVIDPSKHKGIVYRIAKKLKKMLPTVDMEDIISEVNLIIIEKSHKDYDSTYQESTFIMNFIPTIARVSLIKKYLAYVGSVKDGKPRLSFCHIESLNSKVTDDLSELIEFIEDPNHLFTPNETVEKKEIKKIVRKAMDTVLTPQQLEVLKLRYGFEKNDNTLDSISKRLNVSKQRIQQIIEESENILIYELIDLYGTIFE